MDLQKPSIYPTPDPPIVLVEEQPQLAANVRVVREAVQDVARDVTGWVERGVGEWVRWEGVVERYEFEAIVGPPRISVFVFRGQRSVVIERQRESSVLPKDEPLTPGILYIGVAGLAGSVLARNRNILVRLLLPPTLLVASSPYFLPQTSANVRAYLSQVEDKHFPDLAATHRAINAQLGETFATAFDKVQHVSEEAGQMGGKVVRGVEQHTGLRLAEALGRARETAEDAVKEFSHVSTEKRAQHAAAAHQVPTEKTQVVGIVYEEIPVATLVAPVDRVEEVKEDLKQGTLPIVGVKEEKRLV
ncbi:hypothetical protein QFC19_002837 [Naganishia cerealis]|uniref:Uncharacterized protein n=1 Tax=Naganishia cerealis TaxID=610337 RepID=A0ACC2W995_9TREE|nr:hypothetical protein QFC19_002837 [Naganishia cerealis]